MRCEKCLTEGFIKAGLRKTKRGPVQRFRCRSCSSYFVEKNVYGHYPPIVVLHSMELYNLGHSFTSIRKTISRIHSFDPSERTISNWTKKFDGTLSFIRLRKKFDLDPDTAIVSKVFNHQQIIPFSYHDLKLNISSKKLPGLKRYVNWVMRSLPDRMFLEGPRASTTKIDRSLIPRAIDDRSTEMCSLAFVRMSNRSSAHSSVEEFFLRNDDVTVCTELPVFLNPSEVPDLQLQVPLTGHIDLVQVRFDKVWVLDYKPNLNRPEEFSSQLYLYREALHRRTAITKENMILGAFNEHSFFVYE